MTSPWRLDAQCCSNGVTAGELEEMYERARPITYATAARILGTALLAQAFPGYAWGRRQGLRLKNDRGVEYNRSIWRGQPCIWIDWSRIDHMFVPDRKPPMATVTRFVVTIIGKDGLRTLLDPAQGRYTYATADEAHSMLDAWRTNNSPCRLAQIYGRHDLKPEVRPCECWAGHFDPVGVYFD